MSEIMDTQGWAVTGKWSALALDRVWLCEASGFTRLYPRTAKCCAPMLTVSAGKQRPGGILRSHAFKQLDCRRTQWDVLNFSLLGMMTRFGPDTV